MKYSNPLKIIADRVREAAGPNQPHRIPHRAAVVYFDRIANAVTELENLANARNPVETDAAHFQKVAKAAKRLEDKIGDIENTLQEHIRQGIQSLSNDIDKKANLVEGQYASEIRASVRAMPEKERTKALHAAVEAGDSQTVAALTGAPSVVTGIDKGYAQQMLGHFQNKMAPELYQAALDLTETFSTVGVAVRTAKDAAQQVQNPTRLADIENQATKSAEAATRFDEALSSPVA